MKAQVPEIELRGLIIMAGGAKILDNVSMKVNKGEFITLLGKNGSGKTTVLKSILGVCRPASGRVFVSGEECKGARMRSIRLKTGYVPQYFSSENDFPVTALDVMAMGKNTEQAVIWAGKMKLDGLLDKPFGKLSGGEKQKVMLAGALSREPEILLLDEPNLNLDMRSYRNFMELVENLKRSLNLTVIYVTHLTGHIPKSCRRVVVMKDGRAVMDGPKDSILNGKNSEEMIYG